MTEARQVGQNTRRNTRKMAARCLLALGLVGVLANCGDMRDGKDVAEGEALLVAATIFPLADITAELAGSEAEVLTIVPAGADPHAFDPTPDLARKLEDGVLVIGVGAHLDDWVVSLSRGAGVRLLLLSEGLTLTEGDPHIWLDPIMVRDELLPRIADALTEILPGSGDQIARRAEAYRDSLTNLDAEIRSELADVTSPHFVASHAAWGYFAARYGLEQVGAIYHGHGREPGPRELAALVDRARLAGVRGVFSEPQLGETAARALAHEIGAELGVLEPLGGPEAPGAESYLDLMRSNAREFARILAAPSD